MFVLGVIAAVLIGLSLGLLGGGGSILTVPTLHYLFGLEAHAAITTSLLVVALTSAVALVPHVRAGSVRPRVGLVFGAASMLTAFAAAKISHHVPPGILLVTFGALMAVAGTAMLRARPAVEVLRRDSSIGAVLGLGALAGAATGFVGAGGGFVIVPALAVVLGLPMREAIGTSLLVIAMNATVAFGASAGTITLDLPATCAVLVAAIAGAMAGGRLATRVPAAWLRRLFGVLVIAVATAMLAIEGARLFL
ncbi:MAG: sulfite exporter TauE/SafE family protein [Myxococcales bacterium]|nr:sulfite exporter TauE/SafE family protein [Myxococcales bacterium]